MKKLKKLIFALILFCCFFLGLNIFAFGIEYMDYGTYWSNGQPAGLYESRSGERPRLKKGARLNGWKYSVSVNSLGFRGPELQQPKPKNGYRIWCIGGSTTFDIYAPSDDKTWCAQLGEILQEKYPDRIFESINAGVPGEILRGSMDDVEAFARNVQPDMVILYHGPNDLQKIMSEQRMFKNRQGNHHNLRHSEKSMGPNGGALSIASILQYDVALFRVLGRWLQNSQFIRSQNTLPDGGLSNQDLITLQNELSYAVDVTKKVGAVPIAVSHALRADPNAKGEEARVQTGEATLLLQLSPESTIRTYGIYNQTLRNIAKQKGILFSDVRAVVPPDTKYWGDATHFLEPGSRLTAQTIAKTIITAKVISTKP